MEKNQKFPYEIDLGSVVDYVDGTFMLVVKDDFWNEEEIALFQGPVDVHFCYTNDLAIFVAEGGPLDSSDFYFNVQDCDQKASLLKADQIRVQLLLVDGMNMVRAVKNGTFSKEDSALIQELLKAQDAVEFMPMEYDINVSGLQSAYEPYDLNKFAKAKITL